MLGVCRSGFLELLKIVFDFRGTSTTWGICREDFIFFVGSLSKTMLSGDHFSSARRYHPDYDPVTGALSDTCLPRADLGVARAQRDRGLDHDPDWMRQEAERQDPGWMMLDDWVCSFHFLLVSEWAQVF